MQAEVDLTEEEPSARFPPVDPEAPGIFFDAEEHRARTSAWSVKALIVLLFVISIGAFGALYQGIEIHYIELLIFSLLALVTIVAGPVLSYITRSQ